MLTMSQMLFKLFPCILYFITHNSPIREIFSFTGGKTGSQKDCVTCTRSYNDGTVLNPDAPLTSESLLLTCCL